MVAVSNPWTYAQIQQTLQATPATYSSMTDAQVATALNAQTYVPTYNIATSDIREYLIGSGELGKIIALANSSGTGSSNTLNTFLGFLLSGGVTQPMINAAAAFMDMIRWQRTFHSSNSAVWTGFQGLMTTLVSANVMSQSTMTALVALQSMPIPLWTPVLQAADINFARTLT